MFDTLSGFLILWLHPMPIWPCRDATIWVTLPWCRLFHAYLPLFCSMWWYAYHACLCHPLALYASLHACLHVHAWFLLASVSSMLQHNEVMDIQSKLTFVPRGNHLCWLFRLFAFLFVCLLSGFFACHVYHAYLLYVSFIWILHLFPPSHVCWFYVFAFAYTRIEQGRIKLGHGLPSLSRKSKDASMWI